MTQTTNHPTNNQTAPRIVAECWTCATDYQRMRDRSDGQTPALVGYPLYADDAIDPETGRPYERNTVASHRAAGHDVRPVRDGR